MKNWITKTLLTTALLSTSLYAQAICLSRPDVTVNNFEPYTSVFPASEKPKLASLAKRIRKLQNKGKRVKSIEVVGHAAKYGNSDFMATSTARAQVVASELLGALEERSINTSAIKIKVSGMSIACPIASNSNQSGRAKNRRVEITLGTIKKQKKSNKKKPVKPVVNPSKKVDPLSKLLNNVASSTESPATKCIAKKLNKKGVDAEFYTVKGLNTALNEPMNKKTFYNFRKYKLDMLKLANSARLRYSKVPTHEPPKQRFSKFLERNREELMRTVRSLGSAADCYDKRIVSVRADLVRLSKVKQSLYSCKLIRKEVNSMLDSIGGTPRGCSK